MHTQGKYKRNNKLTSDFDSKFWETDFGTQKMVDLTVKILADSQLSVNPIHSLM